MLEPLRDPEVLEVVNIEPEEVSDAVWKGGMRACLHGGVGVQIAGPRQPGRSRGLDCSGVYIPIAGTGTNEGDALLLCLEDGVTQRWRGLDCPAHWPRTCDVCRVAGGGLRSTVEQQQLARRERVHILEVVEDLAATVTIDG